jgi:hypothetical protein
MFFKPLHAGDVRQYVVNKKKKKKKKKSCLYEVRFRSCFRVADPVTMKVIFAYFLGQRKKKLKKDET